MSYYKCTIKPLGYDEDEKARKKVWDEVTKLWRDRQGNEVRIDYHQAQENFNSEEDPQEFHIDFPKSKYSLEDVKVAFRGGQAGGVSLDCVLAQVQRVLCAGKGSSETENLKKLAILLLGLAIAFAACCPQFFLGGISYDLGQQKLLSDLCACGLCVSLLLLVVTLLLTWVRKLHFDKPN